MSSFSLDIPDATSSASIALLGTRLRFEATRGAAFEALLMIVQDATPPNRRRRIAAARVILNADANPRAFLRLSQ